MAYFVKNLGKKNKGEVISIKVNSNKFNLKILKTDKRDLNFSKINNYSVFDLNEGLEKKAILKSTGYCYLIVEKKNIKEENSFEDLVLLVDY